MSAKCYISTAETAKLICNQLTKQFPGIKLVVHSKTYSRGPASLCSGLTVR